MARVGVLVDTKVPRAVAACHAFAQGVNAAGDRAELAPADRADPRTYDVVAFYGLRDRLRDVVDACRAEGRKAVVLDLGYWRRKAGGRFEGYYKVSVNDNHPMYVLGLDVPGDRFERLGVRLRPWRGTRDGAFVLVAGMSRKACWAHRLEFEAWERAAIERLRGLTSRRIVYRPKKSVVLEASRLGDGYSPPSEPLERVLEDTHLLVARHSNAALDAIVAGVPCLVEHGIALALSTPWERVEDPPAPSDDERLRLCWRAAYAQWTLAEMAAGEAWRFLRGRGVVP